MSALSCSLKETEEGRQEVQTQLDQTSEQLLQVQSQLQLAEQVWHGLLSLFFSMIPFLPLTFLFPENSQELERKFSQTAAYATMKKILTTKNEQIKELRKKLQSYEPDDGAGEVVAE